MARQTEMLYGHNAYGEIIEQGAPQVGQAFAKGARGSGEIVFFLGWDAETGFARCCRADGSIRYAQPEALHWVPTMEMPFVVCFPPEDWHA